MGAMTGTLRDLLVVIDAVAALFAAFQSWSNGREIATLTGALQSTQATVNTHVNAVGLHP